MKPTLRQGTGSIAGLEEPGFIRQSIRKCLYLLQKSISRYHYLKKTRAPDILVAVEKVLIRRQLAFLYSLRAELAM